MPDNDDTSDLSELAIRDRIQMAMKRHRESKGWSQKRMAEFLGVSVDNYEAYENPKRGVPVDVIARFCDNTDTDLDWIMYGRHKKARKAV